MSKIDPGDNRPCPCLLDGCLDNFPFFWKYIYPSKIQSRPCSFVVDKLWLSSFMSTTCCQSLVVAVPKMSKIDPSVHPNKFALTSFLSIGKKKYVQAKSNFVQVHSLLTKFGCRCSKNKKCSSRSNCPLRCACSLDVDKVCLP